MDKKQIIYCGGGNKRDENWLTVTVHIDKAKEHIFEYKGNRYLKLNVNVKDQADQYGKDVSLSVNTYEPEKKAETDKFLRKDFLRSEADKVFKEDIINDLPGQDDGIPF